MSTSLHPVPSFEHKHLVCAKVLGPDLEDLSCVAMPPPSKRLHEVENWSSGSTAIAPKRIRGSADRAGFDAHFVMNNHCFTWQNASLKEPDEDKRYPWRMPTLVEAELVSTPSPVGPIR